jgi:hypothetical protein
VLINARFHGTKTEINAKSALMDAIYAWMILHVINVTRNGLKKEMSAFQTVATDSQTLEEFASHAQFSTVKNVIQRILQHAKSVLTVNICTTTNATQYAQLGHSSHRISHARTALKTVRNAITKPHVKNAQIQKCYKEGNANLIAMMDTFQ